MDLLLTKSLNKKVEIQTEQQQKKSLTLIGSQKKQAGHILYEYDKGTQAICPAEYLKTTAYITSYSSWHFKAQVLTKSNCEYVQALNTPNALKRLNQHGLL